MTVYRVFRHFAVGGRTEYVCETRDPQLAEVFRSAVHDPGRGVEGKVHPVFVVRGIDALDEAVAA